MSGSKSLVLSLIYGILWFRAPLISILGPGDDRSEIKKVVEGVDDQSVPFKRHFQRVSCVEAAETASERLVRFTRARLCLHLNMVWLGLKGELKVKSGGAVTENTELEEKITYKNFAFVCGF